MRSLKFAAVFRRKSYNRTSTLTAANEARGRGRVRKAISGYSEILRNQPDDHQVHARIAPLLAKVGRREESRKSFNAAGDGYLAAGFADKAIAVWALAAQHFPEDVRFWERIANEQVRRGHKADAVRALLQGRDQLRSRSQRPRAILLLEQVLALDAFNVDAKLDLAKLLRLEGKRREAKRLLNELSRTVQGPKASRVRAAQFRISPSFRTFRSPCR